eukprot:CAMPEP_0173107106 /NCGR_PEP_ID=MMETSP1102-20130122/41549_1 /TAXON_ID=49646 /ORGANISM="Geminigera sp., Strain Caron Lab Isolate" /LENGTH=109 /DNA_ID=CAMNT_0014004571 /DNA_START=85 /DNA_END=411 /DNA_ORIENTATION=-
MPEDKVSQERLEKVFEHFDDDRSGCLDKEEAAAALSSLGLTLKEQQKVFRIFDDDGDDKISLEEWRAISEITKKGDDFATYHNYITKGLVNLKMWTHQKEKRLLAIQPQ